MLFRSERLQLRAGPDRGTRTPHVERPVDAALVDLRQVGRYGRDATSDATAAPAELYEVLAETTESGATISSGAIRGHPEYAGGLVGFALTKFGGQPVYYSEASRNALCSACASPGHWKLMLVYPSRLQAATYYLAWEDWEGANESSWPNDGDFNDKVFRVRGVRCAGGGEPCDTGLFGVCASGLTECGSEARACKQVVPAVVEVCDAFDNDCDGAADEGELCAPGSVCRRGACTGACGGDEFPCAEGEVCDEWRCVERACAGVRCESGKACRAGACVAPCDGVVCPTGQQCVSGLCVDPCAGVECSAGGVCRQGACVEPCNCAGCPDGLGCDERSGLCVEPGCENRDCADGMRCVAGECSDACRDARCPGGVACVNGACAGGSTVLAGAPAPRPAGRGGGGAGGGESESAGREGGAVSERDAGSSGCGCRIAATHARSTLELALGAITCLLGCQRVRRRVAGRGRHHAIARRSSASRAADDASRGPSSRVSASGAVSGSS